MFRKLFVHAWVPFTLALGLFFFTNYSEASVLTGGNADNYKSFALKDSKQTTPYSYLSLLSVAPPALPNLFLPEELTTAVSENSGALLNCPNSNSEMVIPSSGKIIILTYVKPPGCTTGGGFSSGFCPVSATSQSGDCGVDNTCIVTALFTCSINTGSQRNTQVGVGNTTLNVIQKSIYTDGCLGICPRILPIKEKIRLKPAFRLKTRSPTLGVRG